MKVHYIQHVPFEGLGSIEASLVGRGHELEAICLFKPEAVLPAVADVHFLIILGGPMSVHDTNDYQWLAAEKEFLRQYLQTGKPALGICLGAQLIASTLGARVFPNAVKEIGWFPVEGISAKESGLFHFPETINAFHWHGETFDLPAGAVRLAESTGCKNQAFQVGPSVLGLQFHLETTPDSATEIVSHCREELCGGDYIQSEEEILSAPSEAHARINLLMEDILDFLLGK